MEMQMRLLYDANFPCRDVNAKFIYDDANALTEMRMKIFIFQYKNAPCGYVMMQMPFCGCAMMQMPPCGYVTMQILFTWRKCNLTKNFFYFANRGFLRAWNQNTFKTRFIFFKDYSFYSNEAWMFNASFLPKNMFYVDLGFPKKWLSLLEISEWGINLRSSDLVQKDLFSRFDLRKGVAHFQSLFLETRILCKIKPLKKIHFAIPEYDDLIKHQDPWW